MKFVSTLELSAVEVLPSSKRYAPVDPDFINEVAVIDPVTCNEPVITALPVNGNGLIYPSK
jgi:hypothetical protein